MVRIFKINRIIAFVAIMGLSLTGCPTDDSGTVAVTGVTLDINELELYNGDSEIFWGFSILGLSPFAAELTATVTPADATNKSVTWSSNDIKVVIVDTTGNVTVVGSGTAIITVTTDDGSKIDTCIVTIKDIPTNAKTLTITGISDEYNGKGFWIGILDAEPDWETCWDTCPNGWGPIINGQSKTYIWNRGWESIWTEGGGEKRLFFDIEQGLLKGWFKNGESYLFDFTNKDIIVDFSLIVDTWSEHD